MNKDSAKENRILPGIQCFAWRSDGQQVAICPLNSEIWIFDTQGSPDMSKWTKVQTLKEHFNMVMSLDWHPKTNQLLSASADRGLIVWNPQNDTFLPQIGMNPEKKAHLSAAWNHRGDKFCVGSSSGHLYLAQFYPSNNFWVAKPIKKKPPHKASVVSVKFDDLSGRVMVSASLDGTIQINTVFIEELDKDGAGPFGSVTSSGETLQTITCNGWVNYVTFSPNCDTICYVTHDCELNFTNVTEAVSGDKSKLTTEKIFHNGNPHMSCMFLDNDKLVACGYDKVPYIYKKEGSEWKMAKVMDDGTKRQRKAKITGNSFLDKKVYFNSDFKLSSAVEMRETDTKHANFINCLKSYATDDKNRPIVLATSDANGYLNFWDVSKV